MGNEIIIDYKALVRTIWKEKWLMLVTTGVITALGVLYALSAREEFTTQGRILPEIQGKGGGLSQFAGLASIAGVDLSTMGGSGTEAVRPDLYPNVITSTPFYLELFKTEVHTRDNQAMAFEEYYHVVVEEGREPEDEDLEKYPVKEDGIIVLNLLDEIRLEALRERITATIDKKSGVITISSKMPDPVVAAETARFAMEYLMEYVKGYRTEKLKMDVEYLAEQVAQSQGKYYKTQEKKAQYSDQFQDMRLQSADVQRERIESEYRLSSSFYNELLKKYEEAKFKLHQETPVFQVLEPPVTPVMRSEPQRTIITLVAIVFGGLVSLAVVLLKGGNYKEVIRNEATLS